MSTNALLKKNSGLFGYTEENKTYLNGAASLVFGLAGVFALSAVASTLINGTGLYSKENLVPTAIYAAVAAAALFVVGAISAGIGSQRDDKKEEAAAVKGGIAAIGVANPLKVLQDAVYEPYAQAQARN